MGETMEQTALVEPTLEVVLARLRDAEAAVTAANAKIAELENKVSELKNKTPTELTERHVALLAHVEKFFGHNV